jgi:hypothetical protein
LLVTIFSSCYLVVRSRGHPILDALLVINYSADYPGSGEILHDDRQIYRAAGEIPHTPDRSVEVAGED